MSDDGKALVTQFFERFTEGNVAGAAALLSPEVVIYEPPGLPYGGLYNGPDEFLGLIGQIAEEFVFVVESWDLIDGGDVIVAHIHAAFECRSTGKKTDMRVVELYSAEDGLIKNVDVYYQDSRAIHELTLMA